MKRRNCLARSFLAVCVLLSTSPIIASTFTTIDVPGATRTEARGINNRGEIVGSYMLPDGSTHGFMLVHGHYKSIDVPGATFTAAHGINDRGEIVGIFRDGQGLSKGFLLIGSTFTPIEGSPIGGGANAINARSEIVGEVFDPGGSRGFFKDEEGTVSIIDFFIHTPAYGVNSRRAIVGSYYVIGAGFDPVHGYLIDQDFPEVITVIDVPGATVTVPLGINDRDEIVGSYSASGLLSTRGFLRNVSGKFFSIEAPGATLTTAQSINSRGQVVGYYLQGSIANGLTHGFLLKGGRGDLVKIQ